MRKDSVAFAFALTLIAAPALHPLHCQELSRIGQQVELGLACHEDAWTGCRRQRGIVTSWDSVEIVLDSVTVIPVAAVRTMTVQFGTKRRTGTGLLIGAGVGSFVGFLAGAAAADPCSGCWLDFSELEAGMAGAAIGMVVGGVVGAAVGAGMEVDAWRGVNRSRLRDLGVDAQRPSIGLAVGFNDEPSPRSRRDHERGLALAIRGTLPRSDGSERFVELTVRRTSQQNGGSWCDSPGCHEPAVVHTQAFGIAVGSKTPIRFLAMGRVLPYLGFALGAENREYSYGRHNTGLFTQLVLGIDLFESRDRAFYVEVHNLNDENGVSSNGLRIGGRMQL